MIQHISLTQLTEAGTVTSSAPINGQLLAYHIASNCQGTATLASAGVAPKTIASLWMGAGTAHGTAWYYPRVQGCDVGGTVISGVYDTIPLNNYVSFGINAAGTASVTLAVAT
jgi:hypothetical protein